MKGALQSVKPILESNNICKRSHSIIFSLGDYRKEFQTNTALSQKGGGGGG